MPKSGAARAVSHDLLHHVYHPSVNLLHNQRIIDSHALSLCKCLVSWNLSAATITDDSRFPSPGCTMLV